MENRKSKELFPEEGPEKTANYEGDQTLLLLERLRNPVIKERLVDMMRSHTATKEFRSFVEARNVDGSVSLGSLLKALKVRDRQLSRSKNELVLEADEILDQVFRHTAVDFNEKPVQGIGYSLGRGSEGVIAPYSTLSAEGGRASARLLNIYEAHEKGHGARAFHGESRLTSKISSLLDVGLVRPDTLRSYKEVVSYISNVPVENVPDSVIAYFGSANEIVERMSQLKNYFGMKGAEVFTLEHLEYARAHYEADTETGVQIRPFFEAIIPGKEAEFVAMMNTLGI